MVLCLVLALSPRADAESEANGSRRKLSEIKGRIEALQRTMSAARQNRDSAASALEASEQKLAHIVRDQRRINDAIARVHTRARELTAREVLMAQELRLQRRTLARQIRVAYATGHQDALKLLLNGSEAADLARALRYQEIMTRRQRASLERLAKAHGDLGQVRQSLNDEEQQLKALQAEQATQLERHARERDARGAVLAALQKTLGADEARLTRLNRDQAQLEGLVRDLENAISDIPRELEPPRSFAKLRGKLPWPVRGRPLQRFNQPRQGAGLSWRGVVLGATAGEEVRAVANARVVFADWLRGFGLMLILDHGDGFMSLYGHNESLLREAGEWVNPGDVIATVGDTGGMSEPGLYFEIRVNGEPRDPATWCSSEARFRSAL